MTDAAGVVEKFAREWHLSVLDRKLLAGKPLSGKQLVRTIAQLLESAGKYPIDWNPDQGFDGGLIERIGPTEFKITWKAEVGVGRFKAVGVKVFESAIDASMEFGRNFFRDEFDGINIDWES